MGQPRLKTRPRTSAEGPCAEDGPPPALHSWQAPPDGLFDVIVPKLTPKQFVVVQLVCRDWNRSARHCLKDAAPKRPDVDLSKLVTLYPNLTHLNLSHVEGLSTRMLIPLRRLTALRELCLSNVAVQQHQPPIADAAAGAAATAAGAPTAAGTRADDANPQPGESLANTKPQAGPLRSPTRGANARRQSDGQPLTSPAHPRTRSRSRAAAGCPQPTSPVATRSPRHARRSGQVTADTASQAARAGSMPLSSSTTETAGASPANTTMATVTTPDSPHHRHAKAPRYSLGNRSPGSTHACGDVAAEPVPAEGGAAQEGGATGADAAVTAGCGAAGDAAAAGGGGAGDGTAVEGIRAEQGAGVGGVEGAGSGAVGPPAAPPSPSSPPLSPASGIFGGLGDVLVRLTKLQADLCPALTADAIACLPNLTDLTLDTLVAPEALAPLARLRCLAVKKLANPEALDRLSGLTALLINSDSSCASEFLPVCTRLPGLQSLTFKTSSTKIAQHPDTLCWHGFSRLSSLDLRAPVECLKPGLPVLAELGGLRSLSLDLYCASDEELMVTVVAPPNLESLFVSSDRSRSGGVIDVHPNPRLRCMRLRLYWTALNLVLPEGLPEPSPLPEPLSEDLESDRSPTKSCGGADRCLARILSAAGTAAATTTMGGGARGGEEEATPPSGAAAAVEGGRSGGRRCFRASGASPRQRPGAATTAGGAGGSRDEVQSPTRQGGLPHSQADADGAAAGPSSGRRRAAAVAKATVESSGDAGGDGSSGADDDDLVHRSPAAGAVDSSGGRRAAAGSPGRDRRGTQSPAATASPGGDGAAAGDANPNPNPATFQTPVRGRRGSAGGGAGGVGSPSASGAGGCSFSAGGATEVSAGAGGAGGGAFVPDLELEDLCLDACFFLLYGSLVPVLRQFPRLRTLTLDNCLALENGELSQLCELSSLREVSLSGLHLVTDSGLRALGRLPRLASLRVRGLRKFAVHAAQAYRRQKPIVRRHEEVSGSFLASLSGLRDLRSLALKHLHTAGETALAAGLGALTQLSRLEIKDVHSMSDTVLRSLTRHTGLQELSVLHCEAVTFRGRDAVVSGLGHRVAFDFDGCSLPDITRPCALPTASTQAQLIGDVHTVSDAQPRRSCQHSNQH